MKIDDYLHPEQVLITRAEDKQTVLNELCEAMGMRVGVDAQSLLSAVLKREALMSTGIGQGIAVPHVRMAEVRQAAVALAVHREGIADYESLDAQPVHIVVLIAAPQGQHDVYIRLLAAVVDVLKQDELRRCVIEAQEPEDVYRILLGHAEEK